jgi:transposase
MANRLKMVIIEAIMALRARGWSHRRIADELDINRETVARYLRRVSANSKPAKAPPGSAAIPAGAKPAKAPPGSDSDAGDSKPAMAPPGSAPPATVIEPTPEPSSSICVPYQAVILVKLEQGLSGKRIWQDLVAEHGFTGQYHSVRRFVRRLGQGRALPFRRMECGPGEEAQVDFGTGAPIVTPDGQRRRPHVFRIVLGHSRKGYSEAVYRQTTDAFIRCLENAFHHFGGVPERLILDNLRAAVKQPDWYDPDLNPKIRAFGEHYGMVILPTKPRMPRHKGKVERGVGYVKGNGLKGRVFPSLEAENAHLLEWETTTADTRVHGTTRQQVGKVFMEVERFALKPLQSTRFPFFHEAQRQVHRDGHVEVAKAYYSVPPEYLGRRVWVRWDGRLVRIFNARMEPITTHAQREAGRFSTQPTHIAAEKISGVERGAAWLLGQTQRIGVEAARWSEAVIQARGVEGVRVLQGLLVLSTKHPSAGLEKACSIALSYGSYRLRTIRTLLKRDMPPQEQFAFMQEHPIIRDLSEYAHIAHAAFQKETNR